ncbi:hypothetical protein FBQ82_16955 [Anaerolineae bacterium CFX7]|nr:hypothetical protein [Anaerolineae bacterium CFX7]
MPDDHSRSPRRRPVDVLFGEEVELKPKPSTANAAAPVAQAPGYMIEAPRPVTNLRPPPPEFPTDWRVTPPPEAATILEPPIENFAAVQDIVPPPTPIATKTPEPEPIAEAVTFTVPERPAESKVAPATEPPAAAPIATVAAAPVIAPPAPLYGQTELLELSQFVDQLYQNAADETSDSAALNAECLAKLNRARAAIERGEYATAETAAEQVKARLLLARASRAAAQARSTRLTFGWLVVALVGGLILFLLPFGARLAPPIIPLLRGMAMGILGGAVMALWDMTRAIRARALEPHMTLQFGIAPLLGAAFGALLYVLALLNILAPPGALNLPGEPWLMYVFAFFAGLLGGRGVQLISIRRKPARPSENA